MGRGNQCEERISKVGNNCAINDQFLRCLKTRELEKWNQQLLDDAKANLRVIRISEKSEGNINCIKKLFTETMAKISQIQ